MTNLANGECPEAIDFESFIGSLYELHTSFGLAKTFTKQSLLKHVLTEGDKMLVAWLSNPVDQGIYAFVVNYGK